MIDITKTYKTNSWKKVRLAFIDGNKIHGFVFDPENSAHQNIMADGRSPVEWIPWFWALNGVPYFSTYDDKLNPDPWVIETTLMEVRPSKQVSVEIFVSRTGLCSKKEHDVLNQFASFTVNVEVEEFSSKVYHITE